MTASFDENAQRYQLCCCHIRNWAVVVCVLEIVCMIMSVGITLLGGYIESDKIGSVINIVVSAGATVCVGATLYGVLKDRPCLLIPHLLLQAFGMAGCVIGAVVMFYNAKQRIYYYSQSYPDSDGYTHSTNDEILASGVVFTVAVVVEAFFVFVIVRCYRYLSDKVAKIKEVPMVAPLPTVMVTCPSGLSGQQVPRSTSVLQPLHISVQPDDVGPVETCQEGDAGMGGSLLSASLPPEPNVVPSLTAPGGPPPRRRRIIKQNRPLSKTKAASKTPPLSQSGNLTIPAVFPVLTLSTDQATQQDSGITTEDSDPSLKTQGMENTCDPDQCFDNDAYIDDELSYCGDPEAAFADGEYENDELPLEAVSSDFETGNAEIQLSAALVVSDGPDSNTHQPIDLFPQLSYESDFSSCHWDSLSSTSSDISSSWSS